MATQNMNNTVVEYPWDTPPECPQTQEVAPGIHWLRLPLPIKLNHVNVYLLEDDDGLVVLDTGFNTDTLQKIWNSVLKTHPLGPNPRILCSHYHPDHFGLAGYLCRKYSFQLLMAQTEWIIANLLHRLDREQNLAMQLEFYRSHGMHEQALLRHRQDSVLYRDACSAPPASYDRIQHGQTLQIGGRQWQIIIGSGHTPEQVCLYSSTDNILLSTDHILPRITPNTSVFSYNPGSNPLDDYLQSFEAFSAVDDSALILPCHDKPFYGVQQRIQQLTNHHEERLATLLDLCSTPQHTFGLIGPMFGRAMDAHQEMFALGEILAHLHLLQSRGEVESSFEKGVKQFVRI